MLRVRSAWTARDQLSLSFHPKTTKKPSSGGIPILPVSCLFLPMHGFLCIRR